jgi:predicted short-subunit dehydrogenase-like oxidoreductase (DUF2520 family)
VARAFARWLPEAGITVAGWGARRPERILNRGRIRISNLEDLTRSVANDGIVVICVTDGAIADISHLFNPPAGLVLHVSGLHASDILEGVGVERRLAFHPVVSFPEDAFVEAASPFDGAVCTLEGADAACSFGRELAERLGSSALRLTREQKSVLHAASALLANMTVVLADSFEEIAETQGIQPQAARHVRDSLLNSVCFNLRGGEASRALTGPVARGDVRTVEAHLDLLRDVSPGIEDAYRILSRRALDIVRSGYEIPEETVNELERLLS